MKGEVHVDHPFIKIIRFISPNAYTTKAVNTSAYFVPNEGAARCWAPECGGTARKYVCFIVTKGGKMCASFFGGTAPTRLALQHICFAGSCGSKWVFEPLFRYHFNHAQCRGCKPPFLAYCCDMRDAMFNTKQRQQKFGRNIPRRLFFVTPSRRVQRIWSKGKAGCPATSRSNEHPMKIGDKPYMTTLSVYGLVSICFSDGGRAHVLAQAK